MTEHYSTRAVIRASFAGIALSFLLCAGPGSFAWFFVWRLVSGIAGGILVVVGPSLALSATPADSRTSVGALVFTGIGLGALLSASVVPMLLEISLMAAWATLGLLCIAAGILCDRGLTRLATPSLPPSEEAKGQGENAGTAMIVPLVIGAYALDAVGFVPHTVFWVDYLSRENTLGHHAASLQWGICGPLIASTMAQWVGWHHGLALAFLAKATAVMLPFQSIDFLVRGWCHDPLYRCSDLRPPRRAGRPVRAQETLGQGDCRLRRRAGIAGYGMSALYDLWGSYAPLFAIGGFLLAGGFALILLSHGVQERHAHISIQPGRR